MTTFIGYYRPDAGFLAEAGERSRSGGPAGFDPKFLELVAALPDQLPSGCTIVGSYAPRGNDATNPSVMIVETDDDAHLAFIGNYYQGWLQFQWVPAASVGGSRAARDEFVAQAQAQVPENLRA